MDKFEFRAVIKHFHLKHKTPTEIKAELDEVHGDSAPSFKTVCYWVNEFRGGRTSTSDEHRTGRSLEASTPEMIEKIHDMVLDDPRVKVRELVEATGISTGSVISILHEHLHLSKKCARWVPRVLTIQQKRERVLTSKRNLDMLKKIQRNFGVDTSPLMRHGSTTILRYRMHKQKHGVQLVNRLRNGRRRSNGPERYWRLFFGMIME